MPVQWARPLTPLLPPRAQYICGIDFEPLFADFGSELRELLYKDAERSDAPEVVLKSE